MAEIDLAGLAAAAYRAGYKAALADAATALFADRRIPVVAIDVMRPLYEKEPVSPSIEAMKQDAAKP